MNTHRKRCMTFAPTLKPDGVADEGKMVSQMRENQGGFGVTDEGDLVPQMRGLPLAHAAFQASRRCNGTVYVDNISRLGSATGSLAKQGQIWHTGLAVYDLRSKALQSALYVTQTQLYNLFTRVTR